MADLPLFPFTTQEDWYGELSFLSADASQDAISLVGRIFEMPITPAAQGSSLIEPVKTLTMDAGGLSLKAGSPNTLVFRVPRDVARAFPRGEYTADVLEVVSGERHLFMPVRVRYSEPSGILSFISRFVGVTVSFSARLQPIISPVAITGRQGAAGATIVNGVVPPVPADGKNGDYFIEDRTASGQGRRMYGPKSSGAWPGTPWTIEVRGYSDIPGLADQFSDKVSKTLAETIGGIKTFLEPIRSQMLRAVGDKFSYKGFEFWNGTKQLWGIYASDTNSANNGSLDVHIYGDDGVFLGLAMRIDRATGVVSFTNPPLSAGLRGWDKGNLPNPLDKSGGDMTGRMSVKVSHKSLEAAEYNDGGLYISSDSYDSDAYVTLVNSGRYYTRLGLDKDNEVAFGGLSEGTNKFKLASQKNLPRLLSEIGVIRNAASKPDVDIISEISGLSIIQFGADKTGVVSSGTAFNAYTTDTSSITVPPGTYVIRESITLRGHLKFKKGAILKPAAGATIYCEELEIDAGFYQIFDLSLGGKIICGSSTLKSTEIHIDWFGAKPGSTADQSTFIQNAINFAETCGGIVKIRVGRWRCDQPLYIRQMCTLQGVRAPIVTSPGYPYISLLDFSATSQNGIVVNPNATDILNGACIYDLSIVGSGSRGALPSAGVGIDFRGVYSGKIHRCSINSFAYNVIIDDCQTNPSIHCEVISCTIANPRYTSFRYGGATTVVVDRCMINGRFQILNGDGTVSDDPEIIPEVVHISGANRCVGNPTCDTGNFTNCIIGTSSHSRNIVTISAGMYMSFRSCDMESSINAGVEFNFKEYRDPSINTFTLNDVWFNGVGTCVKSIGKIQSFRIESCRLDTSSNSTDAVYIDNIENFLIDADIVIEDSHFLVRKNGGSGITLYHTQGASITNNRIRMLDAAAGQPAIVVAGERNSVTLNRVTTSYNDSGNLNGIRNTGANNMIVNNIRV